MLQVKMRERSFHPGLDGDTNREKPRFRESGSTFEPAHRQIVEVVLPTGEISTAAYNRDESLFYLWDGTAWNTKTGDVLRWSQRPPKPAEPTTKNEIREARKARARAIVARNRARRASKTMD